MDPRVLPHSEEGVRLAAKLLAAVAQATASDRSLEAGATGALLLALLTSDCSSLCGEGEEGSPEQAERLFRSARAALDACCAVRAAGEQGWPVRGYEPLRAWLADQATDLTVRPDVDADASDEDSQAATDEEDDVSGSERPAGDGGGGGSGSDGEQHAGGASDAEQQGELDHSEVLHRLLYIGPATLVCLSSACSRGTDAAALAAGMEAVALLLVLVPAGHWEDRIVQGAWKLLSFGCYRLGPEFAAACSGSNGGTGSSRAAGKKHGHGQKRLAGAAGRGGHSSGRFEDGWSQQPGGERAFDSVLFSWTLLVAWLPGKRDSALLPSADVVRRAAQMFRAADLPAMQRMRAGLMLGVAHCWMLRSQEASEAGWRMMDMQSERGQLLSAVAWALQPDQLRLLGQVEDSERHVKSSLIRMAHDAVLFMSSTRTLSSCSTEMHQFQSQLVRVARDALEELPPVAEDADEAAARYMELAEACTGASGVCTTPGTIEELLSRCCMAITMLVAVQPRQALVDDDRMRSIVQELMWRCPGHELLQSAASTMWKLLDKLERDEQEAGPESSLWDLGVMLLAVLESYGVFLQRLAPADRAEQYSLCGALLAICRCMRFTDAAASKGIEAVCDLIRTIARLPGMQPPLQLWMLLSVVQELANSGHKARQTLAEADIGVETCMGMVAAVRMVAEQPHNFRGEEASWEGRIASEAAFSVEHNTWASGSMLLDQLHKKNAAPALLRALCQPGLPANLHCRIITCCMTVLARLADGYPGVKAKVVLSGVVQKLVIPHLRMALEEHTHAPVANRGSGISALRLGSSALSIAFDPELRRELGINPSDHNSGGGGGGGDGSNSGKGKAGSNGGAELFIVPDTSKLGFCWTELYELTLETALAQWGTAAQEDCLWVDHWKHEAAKAAMDCIRLTQAYDPAVWVSFLEKRAVQRLPEVGRLAKWSLHEVAAFGRWHFEEHGSECVGCMHTFAGMSWCVADLVERCLAHSTLLLCLLRHGLVTELREAADILELHFSGVEEFDTMKQDCRRIADALAAAEAQHPPAASQKLRQLRRQLLDTLSDRELGPLFMEMQREGRGQDEEAAAAAAAEQAAAAAAEQAAAALLQEEEAAEQRRKQQEQKRAEAAAKQRQAAAAAEARRRQQEEAEEARRRQQEEEKAQRERLRREAAEQARRQREAEEAAAAERLRQEAQKAAAEEAARQAAAEAARRQQAEAAAALAAARQAALEEARKRREKAEAAEQQRRQAAEAAAPETARQQAVAKQAAAAEEAARQAAEAAAAAEQQRGAAWDTATEQTPLPALEAALAAVHLGTTAGAAGAAASQGAAPVAASMPPAAPQRAPPPLPAVPGAARRQYRPLLHQQQTQQAQQGSTAASSASSSGASPSGSAAPSQAASAANSRAASPLPVPSLSPPSMHSLLAQMLPSEAGKAAGAAAGTATAGTTAAGRAAPPPATPALISGLGAAQMGSPTRPAAVAAAPAPGRLASAASQQQQRQGQPAMAAVLQAMLPPTAPRPAARPAAVLAAMLPKPSPPAAPAAAATRQQRAASPQLARQQQQHGEQQGGRLPQEQAVPKPAAAPQAAPPQQAQQQAQQEAVLECCVCLHHEPTVVAVPCGHRSLCAGCAAACWKAGHRDCPICRHKLEGLLDPSKGLIC